MKTHVVILGDYGTPPTPFCVYQFVEDNQDPKMFLCLKDIDALIFPLTGEKGQAAIHRIFNRSPEHFCKNDHDGSILINFTAVTQLAQEFNLFALAELCQLTFTELLGGLASPLLPIYNTFKPVTPYLTQRTVIPTAAGDIDEWMAAIQGNSPPQDTFSPSREEQRLSQFIQQLSHHPLWQGESPSPRQVDQDLWQKVSRWIGDYDTAMPAYKLATVHTRKQQQAIIASRQRRSSFHANSAVNAVASLKPFTNTLKKRKSSTQILSKHCPPRLHSSPSPPVRHHQEPPQTPRTSQRASPPWSSLPTGQSTHVLHRPIPKASSSHSPDDPYRAWLPPPWTYQREPSPRAHLHPIPRKWASWSSFHVKTEHDNQDDISMGSPNSSTSNNLDLLATQATKRQPILTPRIQLPSPSEMLSRRPPSGIV